MKSAYKSDIGKKRTSNEDYLLADDQNGIFILADGIGGNNAGEMSSQIAVNESYLYLKDRVGQVESEKEIYKLLAEALFNAHNTVMEKSKTDLLLVGMGTTIVEMVIKDKKAYICQIGDSRVYLLRKEIKQITKDQTVGDYLVKHNIMPREKIPPQKWHTLTQAVGISRTIVPELYNIELKEDDILILCSDGLTGMLCDEEIGKIIIENQDNLINALDTLVTSANNKGGKDNISVILVRYE